MGMAGLAGNFQEFLKTKVARLGFPRTRCLLWHCIKRLLKAKIVLSIVIMLINDEAAVM